MRRRQVRTTALVARLNRRLRPHGERVCVTRQGDVARLGRYHATDKSGAVFAHVRLVRMARAWDALGTRERLVKE